MLIRRLLLIAACIGASGCLSPTRVDNDFHVRLSIDRTVGSATQPIAVRVVLTNQSDRTVDALPLISYEVCLPAFEVIDATNVLRGPPEGDPDACTDLAVAPARLAPGDSLVMQHQWSGQGVDIEGRPVQLPPADYALVARVGVDGGTQRGPVLGVRLE